MPERFMALSSALAVLFIEYKKQMLTCYFFASMTPFSYVYPMSYTV